MGVWSYTYSVPYLLLLAYFLVLMVFEFDLIKRGKSTKGLRLMALLGFVLFFGFRGFVSWDWYGYYPIFNQIPDLFSTGNTSTESNMELGFIIYIRLIKLFTTNYHTFIFISVCIDAILLNIFLSRHAKYYVLSFIVFLALKGLVMELDLLRNIKSILLFLISIKYLQERKPLPYFALNLIGVLFHSTSILYLPLYFIFHRTASKRVFITLFIIGSILYLFQIEYIKPVLVFFSELIGGRTAIKVEGYLSSQFQSSLSVSMMGYLQRAFTMLLIIIYYDKLKEKQGIFINAFLMYFILFFYCYEFLIISNRLGNLFIFSYSILWPAFLDIFSIKSNRMVWLSFVILFSFYTVANTVNNILYQYDNVLFKHKTYEERKVIYDEHSLNLLKK